VGFRFSMYSAVCNYSQSVFDVRLSGVVDVIFLDS